MAKIRFAALALGCTALLSACAGLKHNDPTENPMNPEEVNQGRGGVMENFDQYLHPGTYTKRTTRGEGSDTHPEVHTSVSGTWLYFATDRDGGGYNIVRKRLEGAAIEFISQMKGDELWPRVSPSGRYLAFGGNARGNWDIYVQDLAHLDTAPVRLTQGSSHSIHPAWSPDGKTIVYASESGTEREFLLHYIELSMPGEGGRGSETADAGKHGSKLAPVGSGPILTQHAGGFAELPGGRKDDGAAATGDGRIQVLSSGSLMSAQGAVVTGMHPDFRPGSEHRHQLVYQDFRKSGEGWNSLKTYDMRTGQIRLIPISEGYGAIQPRWSPSGEQIVFATVAKNSAGEMRKMPQPVGALGFAVTTPDGSSISDVRNPTVNEKVASPVWVRVGDESHLFFAAMTDANKAEFIASVRLPDR